MQGLSTATSAHVGLLWHKDYAELGRPLTFLKYELGWYYMALHFFLKWIHIRPGSC